MQVASYQHNGATLAIAGELNWPLDVEFDVHTRSLLEEAKRLETKDIIIDVTGVQFLGSQYLGALAAIAAEAKRMGAYLTVKATGHVGMVLRQTGLERLMALEIL